MTGVLKKFRVFVEVRFMQRILAKYMLS